MTPKINTKPSPLEATLQDARAQEATARSAVEDLTSEVAALEAERDALATEVERGSVTVDTDRLEDLEETLIPRRARRLEDLSERILPSLAQGVVSAELAVEAGDSATGTVARWSDYCEVRRDSEQKVAEAIRDLRAATVEWDRYVGALSRKAARAGLTDRAGDPLARVLASTEDSQIYGSRHPDVVGALVDGTAYVPIGSDRAVSRAVRRADEHVGSAVAKTEHDRYVNSPIWR